MQIAIAAYLVSGCIVGWAVAAYAARNRVSSTLVEALCTLHPVVIVACVLFWPLFTLNDAIVYIPRQRKDRLVALREQWKESQVVRSLKKEKDSVIGRTGVALTDLRLAGDVAIDDRQWLARSEDGHIPSGSPILVVGRQGSQLRVRAVKE